MIGTSRTAYVQIGHQIKNSALQLIKVLRLQPELGKPPRRLRRRSLVSSGGVSRVYSTIDISFPFLLDMGTWLDMPNVYTAGLLASTDRTASMPHSLERDMLS